MRFVVVMALVQVISWVPTAHAAGREDGANAETAKNAALAEWRQGNTAYNLGHYDEAAKHYEAAYMFVQDPPFLFNSAQSYRNAGKLDQAIDRYRAFLRTTGPDDPHRDIAEKFIEEIKRKLEEKRKAVPIVPPEAAPAKEPAFPGPAATPAPATAGPGGAAPAPATPGVVPVPTPVDSTTTLTSAPVAPEETSVNQPAYKKWWFWTGVGAAVVAGTVTAFLLAHRSSSPCSGTGLPCVEVR